jgi:hypothetical protein
VATASAEVGGLGDLIHRLSIALAALAMGLFFLDVGGSFRQPVVWLDAATLTVAIGVAMWEFVARPSLLGAAAGRGTSIAAGVYAASFVLTMVFATLVYMQVTDWRAERSLLPLAAGCLANVLAECFSGGETPTTLAATLAYNTAYLLADTRVVAAGLVEAGRDAAAARTALRPATVTSRLPAPEVLLAVTTLIVAHVTPQGADVPWPRARTASDAAVQFVVAGPRPPRWPTRNLTAGKDAATQSRARLGEGIDPAARTCSIA